MAQPSVRFGNNPQSAYNVYQYSSAINPNIVDSSGIRGTYQVPQVSSYISSPSTKITFNQPGGMVSTSKVITNTIGYTPPQLQPSQLIANANNPQTINVSRTQVVQRPGEVRTSNVQQASAPSASSNNYVGAHITYALSGDKPVYQKLPKWVWPSVALLGILFLLFGLLWGLGVFGGTRSSSTDRISSTAPKSTTSTSSSGSLNSKTISATTTTNAAIPTGTSSTSTSTTQSSSPSSITPHSITPIEVKTASTSIPTTKTTVTTMTQPATSTTTQPTYANSIPATPAPLAPMTSSTSPTTKPSATTTTQSITVQPSSTTATTQPTSTATATTQPSQLATTTTQPSSTTLPTTQPTTTTVTTTTTTKAA